MVHNPYAPPQANVEGPAAALTESQAVVASGPLYSPGQMFLASFLGSPFAAAWFAAANYRALAQPAEARKTLLAGIGATIVVLGIAFVLPESTPNIFLPVLYCAGIRALAEKEFGDVVRSHRGAGGPLGSSWRVAGISLLFLLLLLVVVVGVALVLDWFGVPVL